MAKLSVIVFGIVSVIGAAAQETLGTCYSKGSVAAAVLGTLFATLFLIGVAYALWRFYWRKRRGKHLVLVTDPESAEYAFDNPCFRDGTPVNRTGPDKDASKLDSKARWYDWSPIGALVGNRNEKRRAFDDSFATEPRIAVVSLRSHDFTGLGFNICGNMRDGIFVKDVLHRGPASESGRISPGDRIESIRISFKHMVFEDALTILSYASPYDVQLEIENAASSRPSTLLRTKRTATSFGPADRICHPFYRSQSIADLAQIGKASLKRLQDVPMKSPSAPKSEIYDDSRTGDYPTLKLTASSTPDKQKQENIKLERMAAFSKTSGDADAIVAKPERVKKVSAKSHEPDIPEKKVSEEDTENKVHKFGIRVLPDSHKKEEPLEKMNSPKNKDQIPNTNVTTNEAKRTASPEPELHQNEKNTLIEKVNNVPKADESQINSDVTPKGMDSVDGFSSGKSEKRASTSLYYDERGIDVGPVEQTDGLDLQVKHILSKGLQNLKGRLAHYERKKSNSTSDSADESNHEDKNVSNISVNTEKKNDDSAYLHSRIPTELPEEVWKAADAARNSRKPSGHSNMMKMKSQERTRTASENSFSNESVSEDNMRTADSPDSDSCPKKPYKRKAPPPPEEGKDEQLTESSKLEEESIIKEYSSEVDDMNKSGKLFTTFANLAKRNNPDKLTKEESDIIIRSTEHNTSFGLKRASMGNIGGFESDTLGSDIKNKTDNLDSLQTSDTNSESDSDMEADQNKIKKTNKGGTTIELNSSHITVHHGATSDNAVELENENTRKAASLGDLSRLDTEQPMSILERAVSLDLADGGTLHGTKKRKAPLPPPCDEYITTATLCDVDDGAMYKKEPRLESAMDTFQRRRLKKSSDWGTLEDALQQSDDVPGFTASTKWGKSQTYLEGKTQPSETSATENDVSKENTSSETDKVEDSDQNIHEYKYISFSEANLRRTPQKTSKEDISNDHSSHQKTVLRITPELQVMPELQTSDPEVTIKPHSTFHASNGDDDGPSSLVESFSTRVISSTPLNMSSSLEECCSTPIHNQRKEFIQSPLISSSNMGISSISVSSTTPNNSVFTDRDTSTAVSSVTDPYFTAVDSTTNINDTFEEDMQPPELPKSPIPVTSATSLPYTASPSTTYITEIQVVTSGDDDSSLTLSNTNDTSVVSSSVIESNHKYRPDSSLSSDSAGEDHEPITEREHVVNNSVPQKSNVTITAIRSASNSSGQLERSKIPTRIVNDLLKNVNNKSPEEKRLKPVRPPVPPRKSETPSSLSTVTVQLPSHVNNSEPSTSKFITFSSLASRSAAEDPSPAGRNSSFEQWVFLDDRHSGKPNGLETGMNSDGHDKIQHSTVVTLPSALPNRTQSVTHIVLDTKLGSGKYS